MRMRDEDDPVLFGVANSRTDDGVALPRVVGWEEQITLNKALEKVEPDALCAVVDGDDRTMEESFKSVDDELCSARRSRNAVDTDQHS